MRNRPSKRSRSARAGALPRRAWRSRWWLGGIAVLAVVAALPGIRPSNAGYLATTSNETSSFSLGVDGLLAESLWWLDATDSSTIFTDAGCSTPATAAGQPVNCWRDRHNGANAVIATSGTASATVSASMIGGQPTLKFAANTALAGPDLLGGSVNDMTFFLVTTALSYNNNYLISFNGTDITNAGRFTVHMPYSTTNAYFDAGGCCSTNRSVTNGIPLNTPLLFAGWKDSASGHSYHVINNYGIKQSAGATAAPTGKGLLVGQHADHLFGELIVFDRTLSTGERNFVLQYLKTKWGIA